jgi:hypothetical protein
MNSKAMDIKAEKIELARLILGIENEGILRKIKALVMEETSDWWDEIPENVKRDILAAEKELDQGKGIPHEEVLKKYAHRINRPE